MEESIQSFDPAECVFRSALLNVQKLLSYIEADLPKVQLFVIRNSIVCALIFDIFD